LVDTILTRIDICFDHQKKDFFDPLLLDKFLLESPEQILVSSRTRTKTVKLLNNSKNVILGINKRSNPRHFRVYEKTEHIRFELELKSSALSKVQKSFFSCKFELFEENLTKLYFNYAKTLFPPNDDFVGWLFDFSRKHPLFLNQSNDKSLLATEYLSEKSLLPQTQHNEEFYHLIQFLNFLKTLNPP
jgi:hypothetical protein